MGWLFMYGLDGHYGPRQYLDAQLTHERATCNSRVLRSALVRMRVYYAAVESVSTDGKRDVWAAVCLVKYNPRDREGLIFGYKDMSEDIGPCEAECPKEILDLLTPTESKWANEWRDRCRKSIEQKAENARKPNPRAGQLLEFEHEIPMSDRTSHKILEVAGPCPGRPRITLFRAPDTGVIYRIRNFKQRAYTILDRAT